MQRMLQINFAIQRIDILRNIIYLAFIFNYHIIGFVILSLSALVKWSYLLNARRIIGDLSNWYFIANGPKGIDLQFRITFQCTCLGYLQIFH